MNNFIYLSLVEINGTYVLTMCPGVIPNPQNQDTVVESERQDGPLLAPSRNYERQDCPLLALSHSYKRQGCPLLALRRNYSPGASFLRKYHINYCIDFRLATTRLQIRDQFCPLLLVLIFVFVFILAV